VINLNAIAYARFSSDNQREESITAQLRAIKDYADKNGIFVIQEYIDEAKSATTDDRPNFLQMFSDISKGLEVDYLLVHKLDRFARNRYDSAMYRRKLTQRGIKLLAVDQPLGDSPEDKLLEGLLESMNEFYSLNLAREVMKGMKENAMAGKHTGGRPPFGYEVDPVTKKLRINPEESKGVRLIFDMYLAGCSYANIIDKLNENGYRTRETRFFTKTSLHSILTNEKYTGTYIFNRSVSAINGKRNNHASKSEDQIIRIPGAISAIITEEEFALVKNMLTRRKRQSGANSAKEIYLLTGLLKCGECGAPMIGNRKTAGRNKEVYHSYDCNNRKRFKTCDAKSIRKDAVEKMVIKALKEEVFSDAGIQTLVKKINEAQQEKIKQQSGEFERLKKELSEVNKKIDNAVKLIMDGFVSEALKAELTAAEQRKAIITQTLNGIVKTEVKLITTDIIMDKVLKDKDILDNGDPLEIKNVIQAYTIEVIKKAQSIKASFIVSFESLPPPPPLLSSSTSYISRDELYKYARLSGL
jgi:site-specific DNA recombinase